MMHGHPSVYTVYCVCSAACVATLYVSNSANVLTAARYKKQTWSDDDNYDDGHDGDDDDSGNDAMVMN